VLPAIRRHHRQSSDLKHLTKDSNGKPNGYVIPIWSELEDPNWPLDLILGAIVAELWDLKVIAPQCFYAAARDAFRNPELRPSQVYLTAAFPHTRKGPHLHMKRRGLFVCAKGKVNLIARLYAPDGQPIRAEISTLIPGDHAVLVAPGMAAAIYNDWDEEALVLNLPSPAWSKEDPDEWPVEGWID